MEERGAECRRKSCSSSERAVEFHFQGGKGRKRNYLKWETTLNTNQCVGAEYYRGDGAASYLTERMGSPGGAFSRKPVAGAGGGRRVRISKKDVNRGEGRNEGIEVLWAVLVRYDWRVDERGKEKII